MTVLSHILTELRTRRRKAKAGGKFGRASRAGKAIRALLPPSMNPTVPTVKATPTTWPAIIAARTQSLTGVPMHGGGQCLVYVQGAYGIGPRDSDAIGAWNRATLKHHQTNPLSIPRGYPVFWSGGSAGHGHIAIAAGNGMCWSTDIKRVGFFDLVPIDRVRTQWGLTLLGWTEDLEGVKVVASIP